MRFKPHVTIAKGGQLSKEARRTMRPFDIRELGELARIQVPPVLVDRLLLCRMKSTAEDGFYEVVAEFPMSASEV
jgi:2'-5' RNA ligase